MSANDKVKRFQISTSISAAVISFALIYILGRTNELLLFFLMCGVSSALLMAYYGRGTTIWYICGAITFPIIEIIMVEHLVVYYYSWSISILPVPIWLLPTWGVIIIIIRRTDLQWLLKELNKLLVAILEALDYTTDY